jgi:hypothetical protein
MTSGIDEAAVGSSPSPKGASARERALRFNRGVIGLCVATLLAIWLVPSGA